MPRFAANLSMMYNELPFPERFAAAAADGFEAVEYLFPYSWTPAQLAGWLRDAGLQQVLFNAPPGGSDTSSIDAAWQAGTRGIASLPGRETEFRNGFLLALEYAQVLKCPRVHVMAGLVPEAHRVSRVLPEALTTSGPYAAPAPVGTPALRDTYLSNLRWACEQAAQAQVNVLIEPINTRDIPFFFLNRQDHAHAVVAEVGASNLQVQMDLYHCQIVEGDVAQKIRHYLPTGRVGHFQIAGVPQRHEPDIGELHHPYLFDVIDEVSAACGWQGWIGCEYRPARGTVAGATSAGLGWFHRQRS
jgi:hydroxypyruvate isomerase